MLMRFVGFVCVPFPSSRQAIADHQCFDSALEKLSQDISISYFTFGDFLVNLTCSWCMMSNMGTNSIMVTQDDHQHQEYDDDDGIGTYQNNVLCELFVFLGRRELIWQVRNLHESTQARHSSSLETACHSFSSDLSSMS